MDCHGFNDFSEDVSVEIRKDFQQNPPRDFNEMETRCNAHFRGAIAKEDKKWLAGKDSFPPAFPTLNRVRELINECETCKTPEESTITEQEINWLLSIQGMNRLNQFRKSVKSTDFMLHDLACQFMDVLMLTGVVSAAIR
jgi:hypothetical protein